MRHIVSAVAGLLTLCSALAGQQTLAATLDSITVIPRWHVGGAVDVGQPVGDFIPQVNNAVGLQAQFLLRLDARGNTRLRLQGGWLNCGHQSQQVCLRATPGCRIEANVCTTGSFWSGGGGTQVSIDKHCAPDLFTIRIGFSTALVWGTRGSTP